jgi:hypothetical protein
MSRHETRMAGLEADHSHDFLSKASGNGSFLPPLSLPE